MQKSELHSEMRKRGVGSSLQKILGEAKIFAPYKQKNALDEVMYLDV